MTANVNSKRRMSKRSQNLEIQFKFRKAYLRLSWGQRQTAQAAFNEAHGISAGTFRNKMNGWSSLSETEVEWMEKYNPYAQTQPQAA